MVSQGEHRSKIDIIADILHRADQGPIVKTHLIHDANLNHSQFRNYLEELIKHGLIEATRDKDAPYRTSSKGQAFLTRYRKLKT